MSKKIVTSIPIMIAVLLLFGITYMILGYMEIIPTYQCWSSMVENGTTFKGCGWYTGQIVG